MAGIGSLSPTKVRKGPQCEVCKEITRLEREEPAEAKALIAHLSNPLWRFTDLSDALHEATKGRTNLPEYSLARHARGQCSARVKLR
jgi:hypothetical protein